MILRQIEYFQAVVRRGGFHRAAQECGVSQSAVSQQIKKLEDELGVMLLERRGRGFVLTPAGEVFWRKSLVVTNDVKAMIAEARRMGMAQGAAPLRIGFYQGYQGAELEQAITRFSQESPQTNVTVMVGGHEKLYRGMEEGAIDIALNDQRRAFSDAYRNVVLAKSAICVELSAANPLAQLESVEADELRAMPCILLADEDEQEREEEYYRDVVGLSDPFLFAGTMQEARLLVATGRGYLPVDVLPSTQEPRASVARIPLVRSGEPIRKSYCLFWKKDAATPELERLAELVVAQFGC